MEAKIYANYGVLAHEKQPVYTTIPIVDELADELTVIIPDEYEPYMSVCGNICVIVDGLRYTLSEAMMNIPWFMKKLTIKQTMTEDDTNV